MKNNWIKITKREANFHPMWGFGGLMYFFFMNLLIQPIIFWSETDSTVIVIVTATICWSVLWLMLKHKPIFFWIILVLLWIVLVLGILGLVVSPPSDNAISLFFAAFYIIGVPALLILYTHISRRVNVTYRLRVRPSDLRLVWGPKRVKAFLATGRDIKRINNAN